MQLIVHNCFSIHWTIFYKFKVFRCCHYSSPTRDCARRAAVTEFAAERAHLSHIKVKNAAGRFSTFLLLLCHSLRNNSIISDVMSSPDGVFVSQEFFEKSLVDWQFMKRDHMTPVIAATIALKTANMCGRPLYWQLQSRWVSFTNSESGSVSPCPRRGLN